MSSASASLALSGSMQQPRRLQKAPLKTDIAVQYALPRVRVPHASSLRLWADAALNATRKSGQIDFPPDARGENKSGNKSISSIVGLTIRIVGAAESRRLNRTWRGKDRPTNVLSFPAAPVPVMRGRYERAAERVLELGDLAICAPVVAREAREQGKDPRAHWAHMVVHGVLHLLGYDHESERDADIMETCEIAILASFGYANPYV